MDDINENKIKILRALFDMGAVSFSGGAPKKQDELLPQTHLTRQEFEHALMLNLEQKMIKFLGSGVDRGIYLTGEGIDYLNRIMSERYRLSMISERLLRFVVDSCPNPKIGMKVSDILSALDIDQDTFNRELRPLIDYELLEYYAPSSVRVNSKGRQAVLRNFRDPELSRAESRKVEITHGSYIEGTIITGGGDFIGGDKISANDQQILEKIFDFIDRRNYPSEDKEDFKVELGEAVLEAQKGDQANESFIARRLRNIRRMAPDIFDVIIATIASPASGILMTVKKIAQKIKADAERSI